MKRLMQFKKVSFSYDIGKSTLEPSFALEELSFEIMRGRVIGLVGPNGAGKSTLLQMMIGSLYPTLGQMNILGQQFPEPPELPEMNETLQTIGSWPWSLKSKIGALGHELELFEELKIYEQWELVAALKGMSGRFDKKKKNFTHDLGDLISLFRRVLPAPTLWHKKIRSLSQGQKQRVAIISAFMGAPDLVILDEPLSHLDPEGIFALRDVLQKYVEKYPLKSIIFSCHQLHEIQQVAQDVMILNYGRLHFCGPLKDLEEDLENLNEKKDPAHSLEDYYKKHFFSEKMSMIKQNHLENPSLGNPLGPQGREQGGIR